jgi:hypothetical protein
LFPIAHLVATQSEGFRAVACQETRSTAQRVKRYLLKCAIVVQYKKKNSLPPVNWRWVEEGDGYVGRLQPHGQPLRVGVPSGLQCLVPYPYRSAVQVFSCESSRSTPPDVTGTPVAGSTRLLCGFAVAQSFFGRYSLLPANTVRSTRGAIVTTHCYTDRLYCSEIGSYAQWYNKGQLTARTCIAMFVGTARGRGLQMDRTVAETSHTSCRACISFK